MELRVLRSFLAIAREENMSRASEHLHISQPALSHQMKELEEELGVKLFKRSNHSMNLTEEGIILRKRAEDLLSLEDKIINEFKSLDEILGGDVYIGAAESHLIKYLALAIKNIMRDHPYIHYHITSGDTEIVEGKLSRGEIDFAFIVEPPNLSRYNFLEVPGKDKWCCIMRSDSPLAKKSEIKAEDLIGIPLFCSEQSIKNDLPRWAGERVESLNFIASFNLSTNAKMFVKEGLGVALTFEHIIDVKGDGDLVSLPLSPPLETKMYIIWKKYQIFSPASDLLLKELKHLIKDDID